MQVAWLFYRTYVLQKWALKYPLLLCMQYLLLLFRKGIRPIKSIPAYLPFSKSNINSINLKIILQDLQKKLQ